jgi:hypothetical protein
MPRPPAVEDRWVAGDEQLDPEGGHLKLLEGGVSTPAPPPRLSEEVQHSTLRREEPLGQVLSVSLQEAREEATVKGAALHMRMESGGTQLSCRLESSVSGHVGILMEAVDPAVVSSLERDRRVMMSRLGDVGIKVSGIDIRRDLTIPQGARGLLRRARQPNEEDDENVIA